MWQFIRRMADKFTKEQRSHCMSQIRSKDTRPEVIVRRFLHACGFRYRLNVSSLPGSPDIVLSRYRTVVFVNGCFWHGHRGCRLFVLPKTRVGFWAGKIERNQRRDAAVSARLEAHGWKVITVWECQLKKDRRETTLAALREQILHNGRLFAAETASRRAARLAYRAELRARKARHAALRQELSGKFSL